MEKNGFLLQVRGVCVKETSPPFSILCPRLRWEQAYAGVHLCYMVGYHLLTPSIFFAEGMISCSKGEQIPLLNIK